MDSKGRKVYKKKAVDKAKKYRWRIDWYWDEDSETPYHQDYFLNWLEARFQIWYNQNVHDNERPSVIIDQKKEDK